MIREDVGRRSPGMVRPYHKIVLLILLLVAAFAIVVMYVAQLQSRAAGEAKDLMYDANAYLLDCLQGSASFEADRVDANGSYITNPDTLEPYHGKPIQGKFSVAINPENEPIYAVTKQTTVLLKRYAIEVIGVYPQVESVQSSLRWYRIPTEKEEKVGNENVEKMESKAQK